MVWRRHRGSLVRAHGSGGWSKPRAAGLATITDRKPHERSTAWSSGSAAAWRPRPCCEWSSFPTHSPSTRSGSFRGRTLEPAQDRQFHVAPRTVSRPSVPTLGSPQPIDVVSIVPDGPPIRMVWQQARLPAWSAHGGRSGSRRAGGERRTSSATITAPNGKTARTYGSIAIGATVAGSCTAFSTDVVMPEQPPSKLHVPAPLRDLPPGRRRRSVMSSFTARRTSPSWKERRIPTSWSPRRPGWAMPGWPSPIGTAWPARSVPTSPPRRPASSW